MKFISSVFLAFLLAVFNSTAQSTLKIDTFNNLFLDSLQNSLSCNEISNIIYQIESNPSLDKKSKNFVKFLHLTTEHFYNCSNFQEAIHRYLALLRHAEGPKLNSLDRAEIYGRLGNCYFEFKEFGISLDYYLEQREILSNKKESRLHRVNESNIAMVYYAIDDLDNAIHSYQKVIKKGTDSDVNLAHEYVTLAMIYREKNELELTKKHLNKALEYALTYKNYGDLAYVYRFFALYYVDKGLFENAVENFKLSLKFNEKIEDVDETLEASFLFAESYYERSLFEEAIKIGHQYLNLAIENSNYEKIDRLTRVIRDSYIGLKEYKSAIEIMDKYSYAKDSIEAQRIKNIALMTEVRANTQNKVLVLQQQDEINTQTIRAQNILLYSSIAGIVLLIIIAIIIYRALVINKRLSKINAEQAEKLRQLDEAKSRFFSNISHDLRTPTSLIIGSIEQVLKNEDIFLNSKTERQLKTGLQNGNRIIHLTNEINELIKLEDGRLKINKEYINLDDLLHLFTLMFSSMAEVKGIKLNYSKTNFEEAPVSSIDVKHFEKVLFNLLTNAIKHCKKDDSITISLDKEGSELILSIADSGAGIPEENLPYIFERYYQAPNSNFKIKEGFGIGLALVKEIIDQHGAKISVKSKINEGTQFEIRLTLEHVDNTQLSNEHNLEFSQNAQDLFKDIEFVETEDRPIVKYETKNEKGKINEKTVLIVEDHPEVRQYIIDIIEPYYSIIMAGNGKDALKALETKHVDIIITDLMMPWFDGFELLEKLKENSNYSKIPVLVISARTSEEDKLRVIAQGVHDFLHKPFSSEELIARLKNLEKRIGQWNNKDTDALIINDKSTLNGIEKSLVDQVEKMIIDRIDDPTLTVTFLANNLSISERKFYRMIKNLTDFTPFEYIKEVKFQFAHRAIVEGKVESPSEAAQLVGLTNVSHFSTQFKKRFGKKLTDLFEAQA
ncbi:hybrid sensor histidine kinase/response regulator transcription factor [Reichenbachiella versicolor]|uniref:hybrid sensor histidine kinase/response regulator transcription factor n=1 Tax=Reichenbachiella versicolor TaxID=1821036 RepID=UPI000D6E6852|nr:response regulator [Reichenbachiella versicolor]